MVPVGLSTHAGPAMTEPVESTSPFARRRWSLRSSEKPHDGCQLPLVPERVPRQSRDPSVEVGADGTAISPWPNPEGLKPLKAQE